MKPTTEKLVCDTILQNPQIIMAGKKEYKVAPPTTATLIEVSKYISQIPNINIDETGDVLPEVLATAFDCECFGDVAAILILGKKNLVTEKKHLFGLIKTEKNNQKILAAELLEILSPKELSELIVELFKTLQVDFFFGISTFLKEINLLRQTKGKTIVSGQK